MSHIKPVCHMFPEHRCRDDRYCDGGCEELIRRREYTGPDRLRAEELGDTTFTAGERE